MGVGQGLVDFFDTVDAQHVACGRAGEFVRAVRSAHGNRQRVHAGVFHKAHGIFDAGEHLVVRQFAHRTDAVFLARFAGFKVAQHSDFAFNRYAAGVGKPDDGAGNFGVVFVGRGRFAVFHQRTVHHYRRKTKLDGALAHVGRRAVVLVHDDRNVRKFFDGGQNQMTQKRRAGIFARTCGRLHDNGRVHRIGGFHNGAHLFEVVDVEGGQAIAVFGGMVEQLAHGDECHGKLLKYVDW